MFCPSRPLGGEKKNTAPGQNFDFGPEDKRGLLFHHNRALSLLPHVSSPIYPCRGSPPSLVKRNRFFSCFPAPTVLGIPVSAHLAMSVTSRVYSLFSTTAHSDSSTTAHAPTPTYDNGITEFGAARGGRQEEALDMENEEPRPPYLHV